MFAIRIFALSAAASSSAFEMSSTFIRGGERGGVVAWWGRRGGVLGRGEGLTLSLTLSLTLALSLTLGLTLTFCALLINDSFSMPARGLNRVVCVVSRVPIQKFVASRAACAAVMTRCSKVLPDAAERGGSMPS
mmetsp:Transcript_43109/g.116381  ORF Transcript_43109/g.116381 Transcript_43109/m.116381 type:complete len:134 (-) Transcript_43109:1850-2251(-)